MDSAERAIAIVGVGAMLPDAPNAAAFWNNITGKRYSITETPADRWSIADYYDPDPKAPDKTYSKIGGWVRGFEFDWKRFRLPPRVAAAMDEGQQWAITIAAEALADYGYPDRPLDTERTGVILGTAMGGELHYITTQRIAFPEYANWLRAAPEFQRLPSNTQLALMEQFHAVMDRTLPTITEDSMPGELANIVSGRVANILNLRGPNFITDAACASSFAAVEAAVELLTEHKVDAVLTGGVDRNMGASSFVKFCKIGALSATGTRPFGVGADGFVMGEGSGAFLLKRLEDAERAGDTIYAVIRGVAGSSDGKGKGITAPNPIGQQLAVQRAWEAAELDPATATLVEAHGTSTRVGDVVEVESLAATFSGAPRGSIGLGSAKSNIGHLKAGAGAAGLLKTALALHHKILPPTLNADPANPNIDFAHSPFYLVNDAREWTTRDGLPRRAGVSAYGFGGTNFHLVMEEHVPGMLTQRPKQYAGVAVGRGAGVELPRPLGEGRGEGSAPATRHTPPAPPRGILALGANTPDELKDKLDEVTRRVEAGWTPPFELPKAVDIRAKERLVIDFGDHAELVDRVQKARKVMGFDTPQAWKAMEAQGIFRGHGPQPGKLAFLFPGQGSQYVNMGRELATFSPTVKATLDEADAIMQPILGRPLSSYIFIDSNDKAAVNQANFDLMQTEITQPAMLTLDEAIRRLLADFGFAPDMVMGHSLGEYGALVAAGILPFAEALEAAAGRGREMARVKMDDNGWMAAVLAPYEVVEATLAEIDGYVVPANINSNTQSVIGGNSKAVEKAIKLFQERGYQAMQLPVSHAFHTRIVAPASAPLRKMLDRMHITPPRLPLVANVTGEFYPAGVTEIKDLLEKQIASPVQWVKGLQTMHAAGARVFIEVGPKRALRGFVKDVFGEQGDVVALMTNHPKNGELPSFNQALCGLYAAGFGAVDSDQWSVASGQSAQPTTNDQRPVTVASGQWPVAGGQNQQPTTTASENDMNNNPQPATGSLDVLAQTLAQLLQSNGQAAPRRAYDRNETPLGSVVISGTGLGLPGANKPVMDPDNALRILRGEQFVDLIPERFRNLIVQKQITRIVKGEDGSGRFETISDPAEVIKLAGRPGPFDPTEEYGIPAELVEALDITSQLAMAAGIDALREAGIPLVQTYKRTSTGKYLPERWMLPEAMRDDTGVIFASAFPGGDRFADEFTRYHTWLSRKQQLEMLEDLRNYSADSATLNEIARRIETLRDQLEREPYVFDRRFLFRILSMGHSQLAQYIGARGPNTQVNAACASTAQAISIAEDWIRSGRCRRVVVVGGDDVTGDHLMEWVGAGFLSVGAATTKDQVAEAALPFDKRRHGTIMGMGACALVVESEDAVRERGMRGIVELLSSETSNSAFHGTRLDVNHIAMVMESLVAAGERRFGLNRHAIAPQTVFMSHETFTPARGGSASAEVTALRHTFGESANSIIIANTKGFTGHAMGVGVEDVIAVKILEYGIVPPVPNFREVDPDLGPLNLSRGGRYPVQYAIHLGAGFGSQIALTFTRRIPGGQDRVDNKPAYRRWLADISGYDTAETEVVKRTLRVAAQGNPPRTPAPNRWQPGTGPIVRALVSAEATAVEFPARMVIPPVAKPAPVAPPSGNGKPVAAPQPQQAAAPAPAPIVIAPTPAPQSVPQPVIAPAPQPQPVVAAAQSVAAPEPVAAPAPAADPVIEKVLAIVAAQTGYPLEMLELDLDMEADLGIDTVKQAETFQAIRNAFDIPRRDDLKLRDYPTLGAVIGFVYAMRPDLAAATADHRPPTAAQPEPVAAPTVPAAVGGQSAAVDPVTHKVLEIVAAQTGYPLEMLELDLDMEADLGIDTVKQAETFQAIRNAFDIPRRDDLKLRDYPTLGAVIGFVYAMRPDLAQGSGGAGEQGSNGTAVQESTRPFESAVHTAPSPTPAYNLADADTMPRRIPVPALRPSLDLCQPTGVTINADSRVVVMLDRGGVGKALVSRLEKLGATALVIDEPPAAEALEAQLTAWLADGPIQGVYWLPALDAEPALEEMDLAAWREANRVRVKNLYTAMRTLYDAISAPGTFLVSATRLGGLHGYGPDGATAPLGGAVVGFSKAYKRERGDALVKVVDFEMGRKTAAPADLLIAETLSDPGVVEVGYYNDERYTVTLVERPAADGGEGLTLTKDSVFLVTGAAGGITSAIIGDLAAASGGTFYLLDLVPEPAQDDAQIALFRQGKDALKQHLIAAAKANGEKVTPAQIDKQIMAVERNEAALRAIESVEAAGGRAYYRSVNLLDGPALAAVVEEIRERHGRIDVLVHAGGIEISRALPDKDPNQFSLVFDIKADGFFSLLNAAKGLPIGATVAFSSVAGRFGNNGQTDYSAANDLLCKLTSSLRRWRPETKGIVIDWTAWGEIGMATRGSIPRIMEMAGIDMLPPSAGVPTVRRELVAGGYRGEIVVGGRLGIMGAEWDTTGGLDPEKANAWLAARQPQLLMLGQVTAARLYGGLEAETTLDPKQQPFLYDHAMDGTPLLPGVMGTEAFGQLAQALAPGYRVAAVFDEQFHAPFKFYRMEPQTLYLSGFAEPTADGLVVRAALHSRRDLGKPGLPPQAKLHFTANVLLARELDTPTIDFTPPAAETLPISADAIYRVYFHGPAYQVLERAVVTGQTAIGLMADTLPPNSDPADTASVLAPRLIELCFQTAGVWDIQTTGTMALPLGVGSVTAYRQPAEANGRRLYAVVEAIDGGESYNAQVVDEAGNVYVDLKGYRTVDLPGSVSLS